MIGCSGTERCDAFDIPGQCAPQQVLELAQFVTAIKGIGEIVALDADDTVCSARRNIVLKHWRRQVCKHQFAEVSAKCRIGIGKVISHDGAPIIAISDGISNLH